MIRSRLTLEATFATALQPLARRWRAEADRAGADLGLTDATGWVLIHLYRMGGEAKQSDLASAADIQGASLVRLIDRLEAEGLVERRLDGRDRRVNHVVLTEPGRATAQRCDQTLLAIRRELFDGIDDDALAIANDVILRLAQRIADLRSSRA